MDANTWTAIGVIIAALVGSLGLFLGVPQWRMSRRQLRHQELLEAVRMALIGDKPAAPLGPDNPAAIDQLKDIRSLIGELFELWSILLHHISDGHGGEQPPWLSPPQQRR